MPRRRYDLRPSSTVFPVGTYAACSFVVGSVTAAKPITDSACGWGWIGAVVWPSCLQLRSAAQSTS
jgi:hypothetical protein